MKKQKNGKNLLISITFGLVVFILCATHVNLKGREDGGPNFFTDGKYNYTYKLGFPTPWLSKYYAIPDSELAKYDKGQTPPGTYRIYTDRSYPVLGVQLFGGFIIGCLVFLGASLLSRVRR